MSAAISKRHQPDVTPCPICSMPVIADNGLVPFHNRETILPNGTKAYDEKCTGVGRTIDPKRIRTVGEKRR